MASRTRSPSQVRVLTQPPLQVEGSEDSNEEADDGAHSDCRRGLDNEPNERPKSRVAQDAEEIWHGLAYANGPRPAELMLPDIGPAHRRRPAFRHDRRQGNRVAVACDAIAQLIVVRQTIHQPGEPADLLKMPAARGHDEIGRAHV